MIITLHGLIRCKAQLTISGYEPLPLYGKFIKWQNDIFSFIFHRKIVLTCNAYCFLKRQSAWNVKDYFLGGNISKRRLLNILHGRLIINGLWLWKSSGCDITAMLRCQKRSTCMKNLTTPFQGLFLLSSLVIVSAIIAFFLFSKHLNTTAFIWTFVFVYSYLNNRDFL